MVENETIIRLFEKAGDFDSHANIVQTVKSKLNAMDFEEFNTLFMEALGSVFGLETPMDSSVVINMIKFAALSLSVLSESNSKDDRSGMYLLTDFFRVWLCQIESSNEIIRWRFCLFLNHLLDFMSKKKKMSVELCEVATKILLDRLTDLNTEVRIQAVHALHWLQSPDNDKCPIVERFMFHLSFDPCSKVRAAVIKKIMMFNVDTILEFTLIANKSVRKEVYNQCLGYSFHLLTPKQRQQIVEYGLKDRSNSIKSLIKKQLLVKWLENCNNDFETLLKYMDLENVAVCEQTMNVLFESIDHDQIFELINKYLNSKLLIQLQSNFNQLTVERIFLWKCISINYDRRTEIIDNGQVDCKYYKFLLPDLVKFSNYIREYYFNYDAINDKEFILIKLLDLASILNMNDVGVASLNKLCHDLILDSKISMKLIPPITKLLNLTFKNGSDILNYTKQILNEIQRRIIDVLPLINKMGRDICLETQIEEKNTQIQDILKVEFDSVDLTMLKIQLHRIIKEHNNSINITLTDSEKTLVEETVNILLNGFELVFQVQQLIKVSNEQSLVSDIIQNIIVDYLECSLSCIRIFAFRALSPYLLANNLDAAKVYMNTIICEIIMNNNHVILKLLFELLLTYGLKSFDISDDIDGNFADLNIFKNILPFLADFVDYEVPDNNSYKYIIVDGFCDLLIFQEVESINLISKFLIIWFSCSKDETFNVYQILMKFFTKYMLHIPSSSSTIAKCYVLVFKEIAKHKLIDKLNINLKDMNKTLLNFCQGIKFRDEKIAINAHSELAGYILDYLLEDQPYTTILLDSLYELNINCKCNNELFCTFFPKITQVIEHFKRIENDKTFIEYLKKINQKFDSILQKELSEVCKCDKNELNAIEIDEAQPGCSITHEDFFSPEHIEHVSQIKDDDDDDEDDNDDDNDNCGDEKCYKNKMCIMPFNFKVHETLQTNQRSMTITFRKKIEKLKNKYHHKSNGYIMNFGRIIIKEFSQSDEEHYLNVVTDIEVYLLKPQIGSLLKAKVKQICNNRVSCLVQNVLNVSIVQPEHQPYGQGPGSQIKTGDIIIVRVLSYDFTKKQPHVIAEIFNKQIKNQETKSFQEEIKKKVQI